MTRLFAIKVGIATERASGAREAEHWERHRDRHVDAHLSNTKHTTRLQNLAHGKRQYSQVYVERQILYLLPNFYLTHVDLLRILARCGAIVGKDGSTVAIAIIIDYINSLIQCVRLHAAENGTKDLLFVTPHVGFHFVNDAWTCKSAL